MARVESESRQGLRRVRVRWGDYRDATSRELSLDTLVEEFDGRSARGGVRIRPRDGGDEGQRRDLFGQQGCGEGGVGTEKGLGTEKCFDNARISCGAWSHAGKADGLVPKGEWKGGSEEVGKSLRNAKV